MIKTIGITGGAGSGKSEVLKIMAEEFGAHIIMSDEVSRHLCEPGEKSYIKIVQTFGRQVLDANELIDRARLAEVIFAHADKREQLNAITHPDVKDAILEEISQVRAEGKVSCIAVEAALLLECGYKAILDEMWFVYTNASTRRERMKTTRGYSDEKIDHILKSQLSDEAFMKGCDRVIDNNGSLENIRKQLAKIFSE